MQRHNIPICVEIWRINDSLLRFLKAGNESQREDEQQHAGFWSQAESASRRILPLKLINIYIILGTLWFAKIWIVNGVVNYDELFLTHNILGFKSLSATKRLKNLQLSFSYNMNQFDFKGH